MMVEHGVAEIAVIAIPMVMAAVPTVAMAIVATTTTTTTTTICHHRL